MILLVVKCCCHIAGREMLTQGGDVMWRPSELARRKTEMNISENNEETNENLIE